VLTDTEGRLATAWFVQGRRYFFDTGEHAGHVLWNGQEAIDVATGLEPVSTLPSR